MSTEKTTTTHFGYHDVLMDEKVHLVRGVFDSVANRYDLMNDLMSFGLHRLWKKKMIQAASLKPGQVVLDVASGTGDVAFSLARGVSRTGRVVATDINKTMLDQASARVADAGVLGRVEFLEADAEHLPFPDHTFDRVTVAFGLRNMTQQSHALASMFRVLKPGGRLLILEFSHPTQAQFKACYDWYSFHVIPRLGEMVLQDRESYQYLVESIRMHPDQETLKQMMEAEGFEEVTYQNLTGGIVALHVGAKY